MGFTMPHIAILIGAGVVGLALLFQIIGLATPSWVVKGDGKHGLWELCTGDTCTNIDDLPEADLPDWVKACRAFGILGVLAMAASLACAVLICFLSDMKVFTLLAPVAAAAGAFCAMIEIAVFAGKIPCDRRDSLNYSFALTVVACVMCVVAAVLFFLGCLKSQ